MAPPRGTRTPVRHHLPADLLAADDSRRRVRTPRRPMGGHARAATLERPDPLQRARRVFPTGPKHPGDGGAGAISTCQSMGRNHGAFSRARRDLLAMAFAACPLARSSRAGWTEIGSGSGLARASPGLFV